ncbi:MAG: hypothetical protein RML10_04150 [Geminocystis sp.]|nr:hypothetical protein [Geminocystis sp.]MDW8462780.1 hypothetical protein [Geminocystis sp.]
MNVRSYLNEPLDRVCFATIFTLTIAIVLLLNGNRICAETKCIFNHRPRVKEFSWHNKKVGAMDQAFYLEFDRPMSQEDVEENLKIEPPLDGKISWSGRRLVYTLNQVIPYGRNYRLSLKNAREKFRAQKLGLEMEPFVAEFQSRDRAFAYIGIQGEESGRLVLTNLTKQNKTILTPENLTVLDFKFTDDSEKIVFSAINEDNKDPNYKQIDIYEVTTGLSKDFETKIPGQLRLLLDGKEYQNNRFDLAGENQEILLVQRIKIDDPRDFGLWKIEGNKSPEKIDSEGGDFLVTPDRKAVAIARGQGIAIIPITGDKQNKIVNFLPRYGQVLTFSKDGSSAAMINFNQDNSNLLYTRSLYYVNNLGLEKKLLDTNGSIIDCKFNHYGTQLFCLLTEAKTKETEIVEKPYFVAIDIKSGKIIPLLALPKYQDIKISMAPDGLGLLFDQIITENDLPKKAWKSLDAETNEDLVTDSAELIVSSRLWLLKLPTAASPSPSLEELPIAGLKPQWSP